MRKPPGSFTQNFPNSIYENGGLRRLLKPVYNFSSDFDNSKIQRKQAHFFFLLT
jgi:hypothetical protein